MRIKQLFMIMAVSVMFISCDQTTTTNTNQSLSAHDQAKESEADKAEAIACDFEGKIDHDNYDASQASSVSFPRFPTSIYEFEKTRNLIATEPQGAVALQVMAFELYRRNPEIGEKALKMNNTEVNFTQTLRQLKEMMDTKDANYARPYLAAALLKGATPDNAYKPSEPYTVSVRVNPTSKYQESEFLQGTVIYLQVDSKGWDTNWRGVEVVKPKGEQYYVVSNCPALYTQCKKINGDWKELK